MFIFNIRVSNPSQQTRTWHFTGCKWMLISYNCKDCVRERKNLYKMHHRVHVTIDSDFRVWETLRRRRLISGIKCCGKDRSYILYKWLCVWRRGWDLHKLANSISNSWYVPHHCDKCKCCQYPSTAGTQCSQWLVSSSQCSTSPPPTQLYSTHCSTVHT